MAIHPTAIIDRTAELDGTVEVGAYAIVEGGVRIGEGTVIYPHAYVASGTTLGRACQIHPFAIVGHLPQDTKYDGSPTYAEIGDETIVREGASIHRGSAPGSKTVVGRRCFLMSTAHIAHNCEVGDDVTIVNGALLAGHVSVGSRAFIGGNSGMHQFLRIGELVMLHGGARCSMDVPPFMMTGEGGVSGTNVIGMRRAGLTSEERQEIRHCHRLLYRSGDHFRDAIERVAETVRTDPGRRLVAFLRAPSERGILGPRDRARRRGLTERGNS